MNPIIPKGTTLVAEGEGYMVLRYDDEELGAYYILKGLGKEHTGLHEPRVESRAGEIESHHDTPRVDCR